jgi:Flp pilus assembly protein TadG
MKKNFSPLLQKIRKAFHQSPKRERLERGQVLVIVTLSVIALTAIVGLAVDTGLLYLNHGKLRRAVDAAALAATAQFREGYDDDKMAAAAKEFLVLNGINDPVAIVQTSKPCEENPSYDPDLCTTPARKLVRVRATAVVDLTFLSVIGIHQTTITAQAVSEAASMDVVFVIDASDSMTYDAPLGDPMRDPAQCNPGNECHPFREVKDAALAFVGELYYPYDRVAIVTFDNSARPAVFSGTFPDDYVAFSNNRADIEAAINDLKVVDPGVCGDPDLDPPPPGPCRQYARDASDNIIDVNPADGIGDFYLGYDCPEYRKLENPQTCGTTSIGKGLQVAGAEFSNQNTFRQEALWVVILLTDGAANGPSYTCPPRTWIAPFCRDLSIDRHCPEGDASCIAKGGFYLENGFDADDYARDMADFLGEEQNVLIFSIGLGDLVKSSDPQFLFDLATGEPVLAPSPDPPHDIGPVRCDDVTNEACWGAGEQAMRYAAEKVGRGHYYFAPTGAQLEEIFLDIAQNLATRLTQ